MVVQQGRCGSVAAGAGVVAAGAGVAAVVVGRGRGAAVVTVVVERGDRGAVVAVVVTDVVTGAVVARGDGRAVVAVVVTDVVVGRVVVGCGRVPNVLGAGLRRTVVESLSRRLAWTWVTDEVRSGMMTCGPGLRAHRAGHGECRGRQQGDRDGGQEEGNSAGTHVRDSSFGGRWGVLLIIGVARSRLLVVDGATTSPAARSDQWRRATSGWLRNQPFRALTPYSA